MGCLLLQYTFYKIVEVQILYLGKMGYAYMNFNVHWTRLWNSKLESWKWENGMLTWTSTYIVQYCKKLEVQILKVGCLYINFNIHFTRTAYIVVSICYILKLLHKSQLKRHQNYLQEKMIMRFSFNMQVLILSTKMIMRFHDRYQHTTKELTYEEAQELKTRNGTE